MVSFDSLEMNEGLSTSTNGFWSGCFNFVMHFLVVVCSRLPGMKRWCIRIWLFSMCCIHGRLRFFDCITSFPRYPAMGCSWRSAAALGRRQGWRRQPLQACRREQGCVHLRDAWRRMLKPSHPTHATTDQPSRSVILTVPSIASPDRLTKETF